MFRSSTLFGEDWKCFVSCRQFARFLRGTWGRIIAKARLHGTCWNNQSSYSINFQLVSCYFMRNIWKMFGCVRWLEESVLPTNLLWLVSCLFLSGAWSRIIARSCPRDFSNNQLNLARNVVAVTHECSLAPGLSHHRLANARQLRRALELYFLVACWSSFPEKLLFMKLQVTSIFDDNVPCVGSSDDQLRTVNNVYARFPQVLHFWAVLEVE